MSSLKKSINLYQGIGILVSTLLGSGIFLVPATVATIAGTKSLIAWVLMILFVMPVAITFSNLGIQYPHTGGTAFFIKKAFGDRFENFTSWLFLSIVPIGPPVVIITGASYLGTVFNATQNQIFVICILMILVMFLINIFGLELAGNIQTLISVLIVIMLLTIIVIALIKNPYLLIHNVDLGIGKSDIFVIGKAMTVIFWCFVGIEAVVHLSSEFKDVKKDFPKTIISSILIVGLLCTLLSLIVLKYKAYGSDHINANYLVLLIDNMVGVYGKYFVGVMGFFTCFATVNLYILSFSRIIYSMSKSKVLPETFLKTTRKSVPLNALMPCFLLVLVTVILKFLLSIKLDQLILYANGIFISLYFLASISGVMLLRGLHRFIALIATLFCFVILLCIGERAIYAISIFAFSVVWDYFKIVQKKVTTIKE